MPSPQHSTLADVRTLCFCGNTPSAQFCLLVFEFSFVCCRALSDCRRRHREVDRRCLPNRLPSGLKHTQDMGGRGDVRSSVVGCGTDCPARVPAVSGPKSRAMSVQDSPANCGRDCRRDKGPMTPRDQSSDYASSYPLTYLGGDPPGSPRGGGGQAVITGLSCWWQRACGRSRPPGIILQRCVVPRFAPVVFSVGHCRVVGVPSLSVCESAVSA
jgi:hypothetical protein